MGLFDDSVDAITPLLAFLPQGATVCLTRPLLPRIRQIGDLIVATIDETITMSGIGGQVG